MTDLNEMWAELAKYQPYAEKRGFGEAWKRMCEERTKKAAWAAWAAAARDAWAAEDAAEAAAWAARAAARAAAGAAARAAAWAAGYAAEWKKYAITYIRKAIEREQEPEEPKVLGVLDVVRTPKGTLAVIDSAAAGSYSVVLPKGSGEKIAWYTRDELKFVGELKDLVEREGET